MSKTKVAVLQRKNQAALIEWQTPHGVQRSYVPATSVVPEDGVLYCADPETGVPYGADWESILPRTVTIDVKQLADKFRRHNLWTAEDVEKDPRLVAMLVSQACGLSAKDLAALAVISMLDSSNNDSQ